MSEQRSKWHREFAIFTKIKPLIILEGNVMDTYPYPEGGIINLKEYLRLFLKDSGYQSLVFFDGIRGFYNDQDPQCLKEFARLTEKEIKGASISSPFKGKNRDSAALIVRSSLTQREAPSAVIMDFASRYTGHPEELDQEEIDAFVVLQQAVLESAAASVTLDGETRSLPNLLVLIVDKVNDLPVWFFHGNSNAKIIPIPTPTREERGYMIRANFRGFFSDSVYSRDWPAYEADPDELRKLQDRFVARTEGFSYTELNAIRKLCKNECPAINKMLSIVDLYRYGIPENPWSVLDYDKLEQAEGVFRKRVKGQDAAIQRTIEVILRAKTGLANLQASSLNKPKGVLFFAGPTGTGKTEMAKTLAEFLFADESSLIRFDMSEYRESHNAARLMGAPPGYIGYEAGGQLTNAVRNNPFSVLLFDEIDKADPSIMDKFLQILEDGRMTDGQGNTVYFSETVIIFTSNIGSDMVNYEEKPDYEEVKRIIQGAVEHRFRNVLGRPEILNRIGDNIVVFDFIRFGGEPDTVVEILQKQLEGIANALWDNRQLRVSLQPDSPAWQVLYGEACKNLRDGGRGIGNRIESLLLNPLARFIVAEEMKRRSPLSPGSSISVRNIVINGDKASLECDVSS